MNMNAGRQAKRIYSERVQRWLLEMTADRMPSLPHLYDIRGTTGVTV